MQSIKCVPFMLIALLFTLISCDNDTPSKPSLTEEEINALIEEIVDQKIATLVDNQTLTPQQIAHIALKSTVVLDIKKTNGKWLKASTGFVVEKGLIATAYHVVEHMAMGSTAKTIRGTMVYPIKGVVAVDEPHDIAIISSVGIEAPSLTLGDSDVVQIGDNIYVCGNPVGYIGTFSNGIVTGIRHDDPLVADKVFQMNVAIAVGSSGGPTLNEKGLVIGMVQGIDRRSENINFAIPVNHLKALLATIR